MGEGLGNFLEEGYGEKVAGQRRRESNPDVSSRKWRDLQALVEREQEVAGLAHPRASECLKL